MTTHHEAVGAEVVLSLAPNPGWLIRSHTACEDSTYMVKDCIWDLIDGTGNGP